MDDKTPKLQPDTLYTESADNDSKIKYIEEEVEDSETTIHDETDAPGATLLMENEAEEDNGGRVGFWWLSALLAVIVLVLLDAVLQAVGARLFWSEQLIYIVSLILFFVVTLVNAVILTKHTAIYRNIYIINGLLALVAGIVLSVSRFVGNTAFWTFFNIFAQPVNALILSLLATWIGIKIPKRQSTPNITATHKEPLDESTTEPSATDTDEN